MKNNSLLKKCALLIVIGALLLIPLSLIEKTIGERTQNRQAAIDAIAASLAGEQTIVGPTLTVSVVEEYDEQTESAESDGKAKKISTVRKKKTHLIMRKPHQLHLSGDLKAEKRAYGLHETSIFELHGKITGDFELPTLQNLPETGRNSKYTWGTPSLSVGLGDARGIVGEPKVVFDGEVLSLGSGNLLKDARDGFYAASKIALTGQPGVKAFEIDLNLAGTGQFSFIPTGGNTTAELSSNWPHPSFGGDFLPRSREISERGFSAKWSTTALAAHASSSSDTFSRASGFLVRLIDPVDIYRQSLRAVKYGILFIVLGFAAFFTFENVKSLPIHPIQYLLIGLAQAIFFLLLTSLSEHIAFALAYLLSAIGSIALITVYLTAILHRWKRSISFSLALAILYAALFGILKSEQNSLLLGSLLLFFALAALMLSTRKLDWYALNRKEENAPEN